MSTTAEQVEKEIKEAEKPWVFRQLPNEKNEDGTIKKRGMFKVYKRPAEGEQATELLEGFEHEEWAAPLIGNRYIQGIMDAMNAKLEAAKAAIQPPQTPQTATVATGEATATKAADGTSTTQILPSGVALIGDMGDSTEPNVRQIGAVQYWEITVQEQADDVKRQDILATDGQSREFIISYGKKVIVPNGVVNVLRESIYTFLKSHYDQSKGEAWTEPYDVPRFTIQIHREVAQHEAEAWLREQKKRYHAAAR